MRRWFKICLCLASVAAIGSGEASAHEFSAKIEGVERATNGIHIHFAVTGDPDFIDIEGSPTLTGIYREEQNVEMDIVGPVLKAFVPASTKHRFFRVRLMSEGTNWLLVPIEGGNSFGESWVPSHLTPLQQIYAAAEFADAPTEIIDIQGLALRLDAPMAVLDVTVKRLTISMGIYRGAMSELTSRQFAPVNLVATVLDREEVRLTRTPGNPPPGAFDVSLSFDTVYRYDRRLGQLAFTLEQIITSTGGFSLDTIPRTEDRGRLYVSDFPNAPRGVNSTIVTKFLYTAHAPLVP